VLGLVEHGATAFVLLVAIGFVDGTSDVIYDTVVQREADDAYLGGVFGIAYSSTRATMVVAVGLTPIVNGLLAPGIVLVAAGGILALAAAIALAAAATRPLPAPVPAPGSA
jgi:hypothetical protein